MAAWVKLTSYPASYGSFASRWDDVSTNARYFIDVDSSGTLDFGVANNFGVTSNMALDLNQWYYVTGVFDTVANTETIYINGSYDNQLTGKTYNLAAGTAPVVFGAFESGGSYDEYFPRPDRRRQNL